jgi:hypothetical protein
MICFVNHRHAASERQLSVLASRFLLAYVITLCHPSTRASPAKLMALT